MNNERFKNVFFFILFLASLVLALSLVYPFLGALTVALALGVAFRPLFRTLARRFQNQRGWAAFATIAIITALIIIPLSYIGVKVFNEAGDLYTNYLTGAQDNSASARLSETVNQFLSQYAPGVTFEFAEIRQRGLEWLFTNLNDIFSSAVRIIFNLFIIFLTLFYLFRDGQAFKQALRRISPLSEHEDEAILNRLELTINSVVKGTLFVSLAQGIVAGIGFALFGIPQPMLWAVIATIASILPGIGTGIVFIPAILYLAITGSYGAAIGLTIWGAAIVGLIDNFLRPFLIEREIKIHPLLVFLSVIGGLVIFGALGFILGPMILSFVFSLTDMYLARSSNEKAA